MPNCRNLECGKEVPEGKRYCNPDCLKRDVELKNEAKRQQPNGLKLKSEENVWLGQERRKRAMETIRKLARENCPMPYKKFASLVSYRTGLSYRKVTDDYLEILLELGLLKRNDDGLVVGKNEKVEEP